MNDHYEYSVIGGDLRQLYLTHYFLNSKARVCHYGLCSAAQLNFENTLPPPAVSLKEALQNAAVIIGPLPFTAEGNTLNINTSKEEHALSFLLENLAPGQAIFGGNIPREFKQKAQKAGIHVFDLSEDLTFTRFNTIATAEGAICEALYASPLNLHGSSCAILGYGNCGKTLSLYLSRMFCRTYVASKSPDERSAAQLVVNQTGSMEEFYSKLQNFDFIFNTIPAEILREEHLLGLKPTVTIIDIASFPGGLNHQKAVQLGIQAKHCPGLPGKYAPLSSAGAMYQTIQNLVKENLLCP